MIENFPSIGQVAFFQLSFGPKELPIVGLRWIDRDRAVKQLLLVVVAAQEIVQNGKIAQDFKVSRIQLSSALQVSQTVVPFPLAPVNISAQRTDLSIIRQATLGDGQVLASAGVIAIAMIKHECLCEVRFSQLRRQLKGLTNAGLRQFQTSGSTIVIEPI